MMKSILKAIKILITSPWKFVDELVELYGSWIPDYTYLTIRYRARMGKWPNLKHPQLFTEKIQWLKMNNRKPEYTIMVDKYAVKEYVANIIGKQYIIPTLDVWEKTEDIDFDCLPNQFVLKTTHGGGGCDVIVCKDKRKFDKEAALVKLTTSLTSDLFKKFREWPYKNVPKRIIAEKFMQVENAEEGSDLKDYKFFCFNGKVRFFKIDFDRFVEHHANYYSPDGKLLPFGEADLPPVPSHVENMPENLAEMIQLAEKLSVEQSFLRVDFYNINGLIYFGELTFYPASGMGTFTDENIDLQLGSYLKL